MIRFKGVWVLACLSLLLGVTVTASAASFGIPLKNPNTSTNQSAPAPSPKPAPTKKPPQTTKSAPRPHKTSRQQVVRVKSAPRRNGPSLAKVIGTIARAQKTLIHDAKRDVVLARYCREYGKAYNWQCFGINPHRLQGSIGQAQSYSLFLTRKYNHVYNRAWAYIRAVRKHNLFVVTRRRLDAIIDRAVQPVAKEWHSSAQMTRVKARVDRLADLGSLKFMPLFFRKESIGKLRELAQQLMVQRPIVAEALNKMVNTYNRTCDKAVPKWPTFCFMVGQPTSPVVALRKNVLAYLPLAPAAGSNDKLTAAQFAKHRVPQLVYQSWQGWLHKNLGSLNKPGKMFKSFIGQHYVGKAPKGDKYTSQQRASIAWATVSPVLATPICKRAATPQSTAKVLENCMLKQSRAFWVGYNRLGTPKPAQPGGSSNVGPSIVIVVILLFAAFLVLRHMRRRHQQHTSKFPSPGREPMG